MDNKKTSAQRNGADYVIDYVAGLLGGCAGLTFGHPFDTIKVRQQTSNQRLLTTALNTYKYGGVPGFFRGLAFPLAAEGFRNMIFFGVYGNTMKLIDGGDSSLTRKIFLSGALGGAIQSIPAVPIELVKVKLQTQFGKDGHKSEGKYSGPVDCIRKIYKQHGLKACFRGITPTILRDTTGFSAYITTYELLCIKFAEPESSGPTIPYLLLAGGTGGVVSWIINIPLDVIKSRMQFDSLENPQYRNSFDCVRQSYHADGLRVFWRGLPVTCIRAFPVNAVTFSVYTVSLRWMQQYTSQNPETN